MSADAQELIGRSRVIRARLGDLPAGADWPIEDLRTLVELGREARSVRAEPTRLTLAERGELDAFGQWLVANDLPGWENGEEYARVAGRRPSHVLHRQDVIRMMRDANDSGADLWMHLANEFGIEDEELKRHFRYVVHEDVVAAATRALRHLDAKPRGAIGREVRADIQLVLETLTNDEGEVVE